MAERPIEQQTLRELLITAEQLIRELALHLEQSFIPKTQALDVLVASHSKREERLLVQDVTVRNHAAAVLSSDDFSQPFIKKLNDYLIAIDRATQQALKGN